MAVAQFSSPVGVAGDGAGNVYVADSGNNTIRKITAAGVVTTLAGTAGTSGMADGTGAAASFSFPRGLAIDSTGTNLYVADKNNSTIRKIVIATGAVTTFAGTAGTAGYLDATGTAALFTGPSSIAIDGANNLYVAETRYNYTVRKITPAGVVTTVAGAPRNGSGGGTQKDADGTGAAAGFGPLAGIAIDSAGANLYVANTRGSTVRKIVIATGVVTTYEGLAHTGSCCGGSTDDLTGAGGTATFNYPHGLAIDSTGNLYVTDRNNYTIRKITPAGLVTTLAGTAGTSGSTDGIGATASFSSPIGLAIDSTGTNLYVADRSVNNIRKIVIATGAVSTLAGLTPVIGSADGTGTAASFGRGKGKGVAIDSAGNLYVADMQNNTIRKITAAGVVTTLAGTAGISGNADGTGAAASFNYPIGLATDSSGNLYVTDTRNNAIRKIVISTGVVTTLATGFNYPHGLVTDSAGNLYVVDTKNCIISKVTSLGVVSTLAGGSCGNADGTGAAASFKYPEGIAIDGTGTNLYVADMKNDSIRKIVIATGAVTTLAGSGSSGSTDGTGAAASFNYPRGIAISGAGNLYVADYHNQTIRKITPAGVVTTVVGTAGQKGFLSGALPGSIEAQFLAISGNSLYVSASRGVATVTPLP